MKRALSESTDEIDDNIDLTPMLDVVFILLIFFIVTATFVREPGKDVFRPYAHSAEFITEQSVLVAVTENDEVWIDKRSVKKQHLIIELEKIHTENPHGALVIQADKNATAGAIATVMRAAKTVGIKTLSLAAEH
jgi:biopolymer transport protein ExbD